MKPTDLEENHVIYVAEDKQCLYDEDFSVVRITLKSPSAKDTTWGTEDCILEKLKNGTLTSHSLVGLAIDDTIELAPCKYGFAMSNNTQHIAFGGSGSAQIPSTTIDISDYNTSNITDFSQMFARCESIIGIEKLKTSHGINFEGMFMGAFSSVAPGTTISLPIDFTNADLNKVNYALSVRAKTMMLDLTGAIGPSDLNMNDLGVKKSPNNSNFYPVVKGCWCIVMPLGITSKQDIAIKLNNEALLVLLMPSLYSYSNDNSVIRKRVSQITILDENENVITLPSTYKEVLDAIK